jgi:hypothetical protein
LKPQHTKNKVRSKQMKRLRHGGEIKMIQSAPKKHLKNYQAYQHHGGSAQQGSAKTAFENLPNQ